jgi:LmbE family N-acetylglucosaminyl deacetylase
MISAAGLILAVLTTSGLMHSSETLPLAAPGAPGLSGSAWASINQNYTSQVPAPDRGVVALDQAEKDLGNPLVVACIAARPGDEDSSALVYCRKKLGAQTVVVFATRGEHSEDDTRSGENQPTAVLRTSQALEVAGAEGADVYFLNLPDRQAGQQAEEITNAWDKADGLSSIVRFIRTVHPDVIISGGELSPEDQSELAVQRLAARGVDSAGDPAQFPEAGSAWSVKRLYVRGTQEDEDAAINVGQVDVVRGQTYARIAESARRAYPSGLRRQPPDTVCYKLLRPAATSKPAGAEPLLKGLTVPKTLEEEMSIPTPASAGALSGIDRDQLVQILSTKLYLMRRSGSDEDFHERFGAEYFRFARFVRCLEKAIGLALGLDLEMQLNDESVVAGQKIEVKLRFTNGSSRELPVEFQTPAAFPSAGQPSATKADLTNAEAGHSVTRNYEYRVPDPTALTVPHRLHLYDSSFFLVGDGQWPPHRPFGLPFSAGARVNVGPVNITLPAVLTVDVVPSFELSITPAAALLKDFETARRIDFTAHIINHTPGPCVGELWVVPLAVANDDYEPIQVTFSHEDEEVDVPLKLQAPILKPPLATSILLEFRRPRPSPPSPLASIKIDVRAAGLAVPEDLLVGYITAVQPGVMSRLVEALDQLGCRHEMLTTLNLRFANGGSDLKRFDSIIVDQDAYHERPELIRLNKKLLDYSRAGGNLVVLAQRAAEWNSVPGLAPLPITLSQQPRTFEMAVARIANGRAPGLDLPNKIELGDLSSWPVNRGIYLPETWDNQYQSLISYGMADAAPGLVLFAKAGEGTYVYVALDTDEAFAGMYPAAYRLVTNLLSLPKYRTAQSTVSPVK